jgi:hypothetical protein
MQATLCTVCSGERALRMVRERDYYIGERLQVDELICAIAGLDSEGRRTMNWGRL